MVKTVTGSYINRSEEGNALIIKVMKSVDEQNLYRLCCCSLPGAEEALLRWDLPAGEGRPDITATTDPQGSQATLRCPCRRGEEVPGRLGQRRGHQVQRDTPPLLQNRLCGHHPGQTPEGGQKAGWAVGLPAPTPRENPKQRFPPHPAQVSAVGRLPAPPKSSDPLPTMLHWCV